MKQKELIKVLEGVYKHGLKRSTEVLNLDEGELTIADALQLINQHVKDVIGEDTDIDDYGREAAKNELRAEQRKRAGL